MEHNLELLKSDRALLQYIGLYTYPELICTCTDIWKHFKLEYCSLHNPRINKKICTYSTLLVTVTHKRYCHLMKKEEYYIIKIDSYSVVSTKCYWRNKVK